MKSKKLYKMKSVDVQKANIYYDIKRFLGELCYRYVR